jgi:hypothetical protein
VTVATSYKKYSQLALQVQYMYERKGEQYGKVWFLWRKECAVP